MFAKVAENEIEYSTVRFSPLKDAQVGGARMGPVMRVLHFQRLFKKVMQKLQKMKLYILR